MYVRFIAPGRPVRRGVDFGLFGPAYELAYHRDTPAWLARALWEEIDWFERWLPVPARRVFWVKSRKRWRNVGICWFDGEARVMVSHAYALAALIGEAGVPIARRVTHRPGQVLYRDACQIVAKPEAGTPTAWC